MPYASENYVKIHAGNMIDRAYKINNRTPHDLTGLQFFV